MTCAQLRELAPDLALGILEGEDRAEALTHLEHCSACQTLVDEYATVADVLPLLAPEAEPSPAFEARTLAAMRSPKWRSVRRWAAVVAATAAAAAVISVATVRVIDADQERPPAATALRSVAMTTPDGKRVGRVTATTDNPAALYVSVEYFVADGGYVLRLQGTAEPVGTVRVRDGHGEWNGTATLSERGPTTIEMVDRAGAIVCNARLE